MAPRRKKADPEEPQPSAVDGDSSSAPDEQPKISEETIEGLLALRGHLDQRAPSLLWPLHRSLPSMQQYLSDLESADEAVNRIAVRHALSTAKLAELSQWLLEDAYAFNFVVADHRAIVPEVHMGMAYAAAGQAQKLAWCLTQSGFESFVIDQFREAVQVKRIDPYSHDGVMALEVALRWQNQRYVRGWYKSSVISHGCMTLRATRDPNESILILCAKEDKAFEIVRQIGETATSGRFADLYPHRVPPKKPLKDEVIFGGRTVSSREKTVQGFSPISNEIGGHFSIIDTDDIIVRDTRGGIIGGGPGGQSIRWLHGMHSLHIKTRPFCRIHTGTINDIEDDDHAWLTKSRRGKSVFTVVVPGERFESGEYPDDVFERGKPTVPEFYSEANILEALASMVNDPEEVDGVEAFRSDVWLAPKPKRTRIFSVEVIGDPDRTWMGPFAHPKAELTTSDKYRKRFLLAKFERDDYGKPLDDKRKIVDSENWRQLARIEVYDPWEDLDRIITVNATWAYGGRSWAVTVTGVDPSLVKYQLETRTGDDGMDGWSSAVDVLTRYYEPRVVGLEARAFNDSVVQNRIKIDRTLRPHVRRFRAVDIPTNTHEARIRAAVAEPFTLHRWLLLPSAPKKEDDFGGIDTRREMQSFRAGSDTPWPILDSLAMVDALTLRINTRQQRDDQSRQRREAYARMLRNMNEFGVPNAA